MGCLNPSHDSTGATIGPGEPIGLNTNLSKWIVNVEEAQASYDYDSHQSYGDVSVIVSGSVVYLDSMPVGGCSISSDSHHNPVEDCKSIIDYFVMIEEAALNGAHNIVAFYDEDLGYPTYIYIDYDELVADDEIIIHLNVELR